MTRGMVAIVKNEAHRIGTCIASARAAGVTVVTIVDTGSTDDTVTVAAEACEGIDLRVHYRAWVNFGHNRSEAFALARGTADWLLALDGDMTVEWDADWEPTVGWPPLVDAYMLAMHTEGVDYRLPLLLRGDREWVSIGPVHEYTALADGSAGVRAPTDRVRVQYVHDPGTPEKARWYASLLEADLEAHPGNARSMFYLAQSYRGLGDPRAIDLYRRRAAMDDSEEAALAAYWAATLEAEWPARAMALLAAWEKRPRRLEPLYDLVHGLNERRQYLSAYRLASTVVGACDDVLMRYPGVYEWGMDFERSIAAWWVGERNEARELGRALLGRDLPAHVRAAVERNLAA